MNRIEEHEQKIVAEWLRKNSVFFTSSMAGVNLHVSVAKRLKDMGYLRGCPDLLIFEPRTPYHGLFVEMKRPAVLGSPKGRSSPDQVKFGKLAKDKMYRYMVCFGSDEAKRSISDYLELPV